MAMANNLGFLGESQGKPTEISWFFIIFPSFSPKQWPELPPARSLSAKVPYQIKGISGIFDDHP
jgi:hypothetical protein